MTGAGEFPVNLADVAVVAILLLSGLLAYSRGLVREVLAVAVWVGAGLAALYGFAHVRPLVHEYVPTPWLADIGAGAGLFVVAFLLFTVISRPVVRRVRDSAFRTADRSLGFLFGVVRGAVVVCLVFLLMSWLFPAGQQPEWITTASSRPYVEKGAQLLKLLVPAEAQEAGASAAEATRGRRAQGDRGAAGRATDAAARERRCTRRSERV